MKSFCTLYLVRHGRTEWNEQRKITGSTDIPLSEKGLQQAKQLQQKFQNVHFDAIFSSDMIRAKQTSEIIAQERLLAVMTSNLIRERSFGKLEGQSHKELEQVLDTLRVLTDEEVKIYRFDDTYENNEELIGRAMTFLREIAVAYADKIVLVVTHSSLLRTLLIHLGVSTHKDAPMRFIHNAGYVKLESDGVEFKIIEVNQGEVIK